MLKNKKDNCKCYYCEEYYVTEEYIQCKNNNHIAFNIEELYNTCNKII